MEENKDIDASDGLRGHISKMDRWSYNNVLVDLARNVLFSRGNPESRIWVERFITALSVVDTKHLPIRSRLDAKKAVLLKKVNESYDRKRIDNPTMKRGSRQHLESGLRQWYWERLFEYALDLATEAGFTIGIDLIHEGEGMR